MSRWDPADDRGGDPEPGCYLIRLIRKGPQLPAVIVKDAEGCWSAVIDGEAQGIPDPDPARAAGVYTVWHSGQRSDKVMHGYLHALKQWALVHQPEHPLLHPRKPIDVGALPPVVP